MVIVFLTNLVTENPRNYRKRLNSYIRDAARDEISNKARLKSINKLADDSRISMEWFSRFLTLGGSEDSSGKTEYEIGQRVSALESIRMKNLRHFHIQMNEEQYYYICDYSFI